MDHAPADVAGPLQGPVSALVRLAVDGDDPVRLIAAGQRAIGAPVGAVGPAGEPLGRAPENHEGDRALAIARAAATHRLVAPPGWRIIPIARGPERRGLLAVGVRDRADERGAELGELLATLLSEQLRRSALLRARTDDLVWRMIRDPALGADHARREAARLGLQLADAFWPAILTWRPNALRPSVAEAIDREVRGQAPGAITVMLAGRTVLLHPGDAQAADRALEWFTHVGRRARRLAPAARPQVIAGERLLDLAELSVGVAELDAVWHLRPTDDEAPVVPVRRYELDRLLARSAERAEADEFVQRQVGPLIAWDRQHHTDLLTVLEAGLDYPRHDAAAARCFMHRNTFRHRYRQATALLGCPLDDPDVRLAVHVALKLRRVLACQARQAPEVPVAARPRAGGALRRAGDGGRRAGDGGRRARRRHLPS